MTNIVGHIARAEYIEAMKETSCGWLSRGSKRFVGVCCPSDLPFVSIADEKHQGMCLYKGGCKECWEYVLKNKKW